METISRCLLTFLLNSLWQIPLVAAVAMLVCRVMRNGPASHRHAVWAAALVAAMLLPLASVRLRDSSTRAQYSISYAPADAAAPLAVTSRTPAGARTTPLEAVRDVSLARTTATVLLGAYLLFLVLSLAKFVHAWMRTRRICGGASPRVSSETLDRVWTRCLEAFGLHGVELRSSRGVSSPVAAGAWSRTIVLPESLFAETSEEVLTTAIGHEMAHLARHDFALKLVCETLYLPIAFQPAASLIRRGLEQTREMACDELVTLRLMDPGTYARSIVSIAAAMTAVRRPGYTLGVFDGDILEERIRRLVERPAANLKRARLLLAVGLSAMALCAVVASGLALTARAQSGSRGESKIAVDAYNRGDLATAVEHFRNAVALEPANIRPKLFLANALIRQFYSNHDQPDVSLMEAARQQYRDVLAIDPQHKVAMEGLMSVAIALKQFSEARDLALQAIQLDARDVNAYYTAGFLDWATAYPQYISARRAAGMKDPDPGIIPDAALRQSVRLQVSPLIEDGFRMLQIALQLDPGYVDAMAYMNLLDRMKSGIVDSTAESADLVAQADSWVQKALAAKRAQASTAPPASTKLDVDGPAPGPASGSVKIAAPPPPPPPPGTRAEILDQPVASAASAELRNRAEWRGAYWQVIGNTEMSAKTLLQMLRNGGFSAAPLVDAQDNLVRVMVGPYNDTQSLEQAKAEIEKAGFRPLRVWGTISR